jgi:hypothetical protein
MGAPEGGCSIIGIMAATAKIPVKSSLPLASQSPFSPFSLEPHASILPPSPGPLGPSPPASSDVELSIYVRNVYMSHHAPLPTCSGSPIPTAKCGRRPRKFRSPARVDTHIKLLASFRFVLLPLEQGDRRVVAKPPVLGPQVTPPLFGAPNQIINPTDLSDSRRRKDRSADKWNKTLAASSCAPTCSTKLVCCGGNLASGRLTTEPSLPPETTLVRVQLREARGKLHISVQQLSDDTAINSILIQ